MLAVEGVYKNGKLLLPTQIQFNHPVKVIVTFLEKENITHNNKSEKLVAELYSNDNITLKQAQYLLNHSNWEDTVVALEQQGCQLYYDKDDLEEDLESVVLFKEKSQ